jgi:hypothetical protein
MFRSIRFTLLLLLSFSGLAFAQESRESIPVRTYSLKRLAVTDAAKLLSPYLQSAMSGAYETGSDARAITVRGTARELRVVDSLLAIFDSNPRTVLLRFQIIEATEDAKKDSRIAELDASLHELFRYSGYRLIGEGVARSEEVNPFQLSIGADGVSYNIAGSVYRIDDAAGSVRLGLRLGQPTLLPMMGNQDLFGTQLNVPIGQMIVLGSAAPRFYDGKATDTLTMAKLSQSPRLGRPIILTVRAEFPSRK